MSFIRTLTKCCVMFKHGSLFSGIGGFDLAAEWMGWENVFHCEWNEFGQKILKYYWPKAISYGDITKTDFTIHRGQIDILTGGFPCQPYSQAGKRLGKEDDRHLWPEMLRAIREIQPKYVVGENVSGILNWNGGLVFDEVQADLENEGYEVIPVVLPACGKNAPHKRERVWFVAYRNGLRRTQKHELQQPEICKQYGKGGTSSDTGLQRQEKRQEQSVGVDELCEERDAANTTGTKHKKGLQSRKEQAHSTFGNSNDFNYWYNWPTQSPICGGDDGLSARLDKITFSKWRNESIKAYGNAIVPQVAHEIFKAISKAGSAGQKKQ